MEVSYTPPAQDQTQATSPNGGVTISDDTSSSANDSKDQYKDSEDGEHEFSFWYWPGGPHIINLGTHESPADIIGSSAYSYFLVPNAWAIFLALIVVVFQCYLFVILWRDGDEVTNDDFREDSKNRALGITGAVFMLILRVLPRIGQGFELIGMGLGLVRRDISKPRTYELDVRLLFVGIVVLLVATGCVCVGIRFALNKASTVVRTITIATVALFIEGIDEHMYSFLKYMSRPAWHEWSTKLLEDEYGDSNKED